MQLVSLQLGIFKLEKLPGQVTLQPLHEDISVKLVLVTNATGHTCFLPNSLRISATKFPAGTIRQCDIQVYHLQTTPESSNGSF